MRKERKDKIFWLVFIVLAFTALLFSGCKSKTVYVPIETTKIEYKDKLIKDSIFQLDSVFLDRYLKSDTMFITKEKYKYIYKDKIVKDTVAITDSIQVPYPVKGDPIPYVTGFQSFQIWCGRILLFILLAYFGFMIVKRYIK